MTSNTIILAAASLGITLLLGGIFFASKGKLFKASRRAILGCFMIFIAFGFGAVSFNLYTYHKLTEEQEVLTLELRKLGEKDYLAYLNEVGTKKNQPQLYELKGDQWQVGVKVLKWPGWVNLLGIKNLYRLDRLNSMYKDVDKERESEHSVYSLTDSPELDLWQLAQKYAKWFPWIDAVYGSATYMPMEDGVHYQITLGSSGLIARPFNGKNIPKKVTPVVKS